MMCFVKSMVFFFDSNLAITHLVWNMPGQLQHRRRLMQKGLTDIQGTIRVRTNTEYGLITYEVKSLINNLISKLTAMIRIITESQ